MPGPFSEALMPPLARPVGIPPEITWRTAPQVKQSVV